ncbi:MAG TPA: Hsp20/alpha crystallin family protein [Opitutaceae bacterium]|jgi:HSP20 family protein|nr:Hsp20/alpha crystallin family protein [Opitutaceae bacterium]
MRIIRYTQPASRRFAPALSFPRSPWTGFESEIDRLFETALTGLAGAPYDRPFPVDLYEDKDNTYVRAELPGVNRDDINVELVAGNLTVTAARKQKNGDKEESYTFSRSVGVSEAVQADKVAATYENGVLTVTLPKREEAKPKKVTVAVK